MPSREAFNSYSNPNATAYANRRKESRRHPRESSRDPSKNRAWTEDPPAPLSSKDTTPHPASVDPTPPAPVDPTPPTPHNQTPPAQPGNTKPEAILNTAYNSTNDKLKRLSRHRRSQEAFTNVSSMKVDKIFSRALNEVLSVKEMVAKHAKEIKIVKERLTEQPKAAEARHAEQLKAIEANHVEQLRETEEKNAKLGEELKQHKEALAKATEKSNPEANFDYLPKHMKQAELAKCIALLEEEEKAQGSPEISLATGIEGVDEDVGASVNQQPKQDPPATPTTQ
ncbi:uncharacterized protein LOC133824287 [Humulus lupulus]|uniref:uncharacterized protein LOC133824287 n=1 Tax=Humulus lupulus TaxID=3486 RepID=UPI002B40BEC7|nr:uncharacterized protein LOC133824287 [Humulus lupulus]